MKTIISPTNHRTRYFMCKFCPERTRCSAFTAINRAVNGAVHRRRNQLGKVAGVAPTALRELRSGSQSQPLPNLHRAGVAVQTASVSFWKCLLLSSYIFPSYLSLLYKYIYYLT